MAGHTCLGYLPLAIDVVGVEVDGGRGVGEVHFVRGVGPCTKDYFTALDVEGIVCDVDITHGFEDSAGLPAYITGMVHDCTEQREVSLDFLRSEK